MIYQSVLQILNEKMMMMQAYLRNILYMEVRVMYGVAAGDVRTTTGRNIWFLKTETGLDPTCSKQGGHHTRQRHVEDQVPGKAIGREGAGSL